VALREQVAATARRLGTPVPGPERDSADPGVFVPRPAFWGGYWLVADAVELWVEGESRLHDRVRWTRPLEPEAEGFRPGAWRSARLQP